MTILTSRLRCDASDDKAKAVEIAKLLSAFPAQGHEDVTEDLRTENYFDALSGLPAWAVRQARERIVRGETEFGRPWGPGPIQFADMVRGVTKPVERDMEEVRVLLSAKPFVEREPPPDERQRVISGFDGLLRVSEKLRAEKAKAMAASRASLAEINQRLFVRDCQAAGIDPKRNVSPQLLQLLKEQGERWA